MSQDIKQEAVEAFDEIDGIDTYYKNSNRSGLIKVQTEDAIGQFFRVRREVEADVYAVERGSDLDTVLDALVR